MVTQKPRPTPLSPPDETTTAGNPDAMATHLTVIAVLNFIWAGFAVIGGLFVLFAFSVGAAGAGEGEDSGAPEWVSEMVASLGVLLFIIILALAALSFFAGLYVMKRKRVGKVLACITAILALFNLPFGTAFGIYALIILFNERTEAYWVD